MVRRLVKEAHDCVEWPTPRLGQGTAKGLLWEPCMTRKEQSLPADQCDPESFQLSAIVAGLTDRFNVYVLNVITLMQAQQKMW